MKLRSKGPGHLEWVNLPEGTILDAVLEADSENWPDCGLPVVLGVRLVVPTEQPAEADYAGVEGVERVASVRIPAGAGEIHHAPLFYLLRAFSIAWVSLEEKALIEQYGTEYERAQFNANG
jgi:hypothetical protein